MDIKISITKLDSKPTQRLQHQIFQLRVLHYKNLEWERWRPIQKDTLTSYWKWFNHWANQWAKHCETWTYPWHHWANTWIWIQSSVASTAQIVKTKLKKAVVISQCNREVQQPYFQQKGDNSCYLNILKLSKLFRLETFRDCLLLPMLTCRLRQ